MLQIYHELVIPLIGSWLDGCVYDTEPGVVYWNNNKHNCDLLLICQGTGIISDKDWPITFDLAYFQSLKITKICSHRYGLYESKAHNQHSQINSKEFPHPSILHIFFIVLVLRSLDLPLVRTSSEYSTFRGDQFGP